MDMDGSGAASSSVTPPTVAVKDRLVRLCGSKPAKEAPPSPEQKKEWDKQRAMYDAIECASESLESSDMPSITVAARFL